jgi:hypothetical protein
MTATAVVVHERPILFSGEMVRAILDGRKTQTRRALNPQPDSSLNAYTARQVDRFKLVGVDVKSRRAIFEAGNFAGPINAFRDGRDSVKADIACPYGAVGGRLWVRETFGTMLHADGERVHYLADGATPKDWRGNALRWRPSIHMPCWASRLTLEITDVRVERLQSISYADVLAEGCPVASVGASPADHDWYRQLWESLNATRGFGWDVNPWVWVISFKQVTP